MAKKTKTKTKTEKKKRDDGFKIVSCRFNADQLVAIDAERYRLLREEGLPVSRSGMMSRAVHLMLRLQSDVPTQHERSDETLSGFDM